MYTIIGASQREYGPVSGEQIREWLNQGRLIRLSRARSEGAPGWRSLELVPEFAHLLGTPSAPPVISPGVPTSTDAGSNVVIPYGNMRALIAYYLAVFSLIPFVGIVLGLRAFVLGILGLRFRRNHPSAGGTVHSWIGIVLGGLCGFGYLALMMLALGAMARRH